MRTIAAGLLYRRYIRRVERGGKRENRRAEYVAGRRLYNMLSMEISNARNEDGWTAYA